MDTLYKGLERKTLPCSISAVVTFSVSDNHGRITMGTSTYTALRMASSSALIRSISSWIAFAFAAASSSLFLTTSSIIANSLFFASNVQQIIQFCP